MVSHRSTNQSINQSTVIIEFINFITTRIINRNAPNELLQLSYLSSYQYFLI